MSGERDEFRREQLWQEAANLHYDVSFFQILAEKITQKWARVTFFTTSFIVFSLTGVFASNMFPFPNWVGSTISVVSILLTLIQFLRFNEKANLWKSISKDLSKIRMKMDALHCDIRSDYDFDVSFYAKALTAIRNDFASVHSEIDSTDFFYKDKRRKIACDINNEVMNGYYGRETTTKATKTTA